MRGESAEAGCRDVVKVDDGGEVDEGAHLSATLGTPFPGRVDLREGPSDLTQVFRDALSHREHIRIVQEPREERRESDRGRPRNERATGRRRDESHGAVHVRQQAPAVVRRRHLDQRDRLRDAGSSPRMRGTV